MEQPTVEVMTLAEVAAAFRVSKSTVQRWVNAGRLPAIRLGGRSVRFRRADVEALLMPTPIAGFRQIGFTDGTTVTPTPIEATA